MKSGRKFKEPLTNQERKMSVAAAGFISSSGAKTSRF